MMKGVGCLVRRKMLDCNFVQLELNLNLKVAEMCIGNIFNLQEIVNKCIESNSIESVLSFKGDYFSYEDFYHETYRKELSLLDKARQCELKYESCNSELEKLKESNKKIASNIEYKVKKYNQEVSIIKQLNKLCQDMNALNCSQIYLKFGRDKHHDLIAIFFDVGQFANEDSGTIYVFSGHDEQYFNTQTSMNISYTTYPEFHSESQMRSTKTGAQVIINSISSNNRRRGNGTFLLNHFEDILHKVNKELRSANSKEEITTIFGDVVPGNIRHESLVALYNNNGFPTWEEDRVIFKELKKVKVPNKAAIHIPYGG